MTHDFTIGWLYPRKMNIYGDRGNVIALQRRAEWRGHPRPGGARSASATRFRRDIDVFFFGGGQDQRADRRLARLQGAKGERAAKRRSKRGRRCWPSAAAISSSGTNIARTTATPLPGIGLFDVVTVAGPERFIGNVVVESRLGRTGRLREPQRPDQPRRRHAPMGRVKVGAATTARTAPRARSTSTRSAATCTARSCRRTRP